MSRFYLVLFNAAEYLAYFFTSCLIQILKILVQNY